MEQKYIRFRQHVDHAKKIDQMFFFDAMSGKIDSTTRNLRSANEAQTRIQFATSRVSCRCLFDMCSLRVDVDPVVRGDATML